MVASERSRQPGGGAACCRVGRALPGQRRADLAAACCQVSSVRPACNLAHRLLSAAHSWRSKGLRVSGWWWWWGWWWGDGDRAAHPAPSNPPLSSLRFDPLPHRRPHLLPASHSCPPKGHSPAQTHTRWQRQQRHRKREHACLQAIRACMDVHAYMRACMHAHAQACADMHRRVIVIMQDTCMHACMHAGVHAGSGHNARSGRPHRKVECEDGHPQRQQDPHRLLRVAPAAAVAVAVDDAWQPSVLAACVLWHKVAAHKLQPLLVGLRTSTSIE
eukprot:41760-Chlamydomonas_euryale.AAC.2